MMPRFLSPLGRGGVALALLLAASFVPAPASAQRAVPDNREQIQLSFAPVVKQVIPAVVNIYTTRTVRQRVSPLFDDPLFRRFFGDALGGVPRERMEASLGSGVIVSADGLIITNAHVIQDSDQIQVVLADRREFPAKLVSQDERVDLAVLRIDTKGERLPFLQLRDSDDLEVGDLVLAIGNPFGVGQTVTSGIVSAVARTAVGVSDYNFFIQTDAAINPGNSGGALVTMDGRLVGINSAIYSRNGGSIGIGFAIPSNMVRTVIDAVAAGGKLVRPWIGADGQAVTADLAAGLNLARPGGVLINQVRPGGPADKAGLRRGDVITGVNGREVDGPDALRYRIATLPIGGKATLTVLRGGKEQQLTLGLIAPPEDPPREVTTLQGRNPLAGAEVGNLNPALIEEIGFSGAQEGVVVLQVARGSPAAMTGLRPGDVILRINGTAIERVRDLSAELARRARAWTIDVQRGDQVLTTTIGG
ncbi:DegQ family serine endoprotease [Rhodospirillum centenum]|uniref:Periplasmic serine protease, Do n=1 Tax=Rhodospirillum centenum (strain ATCC 51521 / SW) TaxID=414684 RepID=B6IQY2_RHOCS|nr:DegQ family serine endoprotease [Rhodospirillum centenum]ACI97868.1 periplasmic serine protease, Do [Rhodospirillum centenum SW]